MATYKVPQDVEAEDKLLGPFSFRQFIYLIVVAISGVAAWGLWQLMPPLAIIPVPFAVIFLILALPLRKDQPMEIYAAALVSFLLKPRKRLWEPDGLVSLVTIEEPTDTDIKISGLSQDEATKRLEYLSSLVDSQGWAVRGLSDSPDDPIRPADEVADEDDILDESNELNQSFSKRLDDSTDQRWAQLREQFQAGASTQQQQRLDPDAVLQPMPVAGTPAPQLVQDQAAEVPNTPSQPTVSDDIGEHSEPAPQLNPYPGAMRQSVIHPVGTPGAQQQEAAQQAAEQAAEPSEVAEEEASTSETPPSPDIINLANNSDFSVETIAREAGRIKAKSEQEVVLKLH